jgi:hypothetical protein
VAKAKKNYWTDEHKTAFRKVKDHMAQEIMLTYPQFNKPFIIFTDASEKQKLMVLSLKKINH